MTAPRDVLRGELERHFELEDMKRLAVELLATDPEAVGGTSSKAAFSRALVDWCATHDGLEALSDAIVLGGGGREARERLRVVFEDIVGEELRPGTDVSGFRIVKRIGEGSIGVVYQAERADGAGGTERVALKVVRRRLARDRAAVRRYTTICRALARSGAPGMAPVLGVGVLEDGRPWVATRFIDGPTLAARIARVGPMHINEVRPVMRTVLEALEALHRRGLVHGDVKAENVFLVRSAPGPDGRSEATGVLVDGGTDRLLARGGFDAGVLPLFGSAKICSPELARGAPLSPQSDVYAAGITLYEALTGKPPFSGPSAWDIVGQHLTAQAPEPSSVAPRGWVSREVDAIVLRAIARDPADRYRSAAELLEALESIGRERKSAGERPRAALDETALAIAVDALMQNPDEEERALAIERVVEPAGAWARAVEALQRAVEAATSTEAKKALLFRIARIQESELESHDGAEAAYLRVLEIDPEDEIAQVGLEEIKRARGKPEDLVDLLLSKAEREQLPAERASILREVAVLYEERLNDPAHAFVVWVQSLTDDPHDARARAALERLAGEDPTRWSEAVQTLSNAANEAQEPSRAAALWVLLGTTYAVHLKRPDFALQCLGRALQLEPTSNEAYEAIAELYRRAQSWRELVTLYLRRAEVEPNPARARDLRVEAADVAHRYLGDVAQAIGLYQQVLEADPAHPRAGDALEVLHAERKDWAALARLLEARSHATRGADRVAALLRLAELYEDRLDDADRAAIQYEAVLAHDADNLDALKGLERILARASRHRELLANLRRQLALAPTPRQKIALLERIGALEEEEFVDIEKAVEAFEAIVAIEPGHEAANVALARLYRRLQRFDALAETLDRHARAASEPLRKAELLLQCARVLAEDVGAPDRALRVCERLLAVDPRHAQGLELLARLRAQTGDAAAAVEATERLAEAETDGRRKADLYVRAGRLLEERGDRDGAVERYRKALDAHPACVEAISALRAIYAARGDAHGAVELLQLEIATVEGAISKARLYAEQGALYRERLNDPERARIAFRKALELDPTCTPAARGLGEMAWEREQWAEAARHLEPLLARAGELPREQARTLCVRCGDALRRLGENERAQRAYLNARGFAPDDREVLERLAELTFETGEPEEAASMYRDLLERFDAQLHAGERGRILYRIGEALRRSGQLDDAVGFLERAAEHMPESPEPLAALRQAHAARGDWPRVVEVLRRRMDHADDAERFELLVDAGDVLFGKMGDRQKAARTWVAALEIRPDDRNVLTKLMGVYSESKDWSRLVEVILRIADLVSDPRQLGKYYNTAAAISHRELGRLDEAADYYGRALDADPELEGAFEGLVECLTQKREWTALAEAYRAQLRRMGERAPASRRAALWDALGELVRTRLQRPAEAAEAYERAAELDPDSRHRLEILAEIYDSDPRRWFHRAVATHASLLRRSPYRTESYQALRRLYAELGRTDETWCLCQALHCLNMAEPDEEDLYRRHRTRQPAAPQEFVDESMWFDNLLHPDQDPLLTGLFAVITPAVIASRAQRLESFGVHPTPVDAERDEAAMARMLHFAAAVLQIPLPPVHYRPSDPGGLSFLFTDPPRIGLGAAALAGGPAQALAFVAARHLSYFRPGHYLRYLVPTGSGLRAWLLAALRLVQPAFPVPPDLAGPVSEHTAALRQHLTPQSRDELASLVSRLLAASPALDLKRWVASVDLTADRVGFVLSNDLEIAAAIVRAGGDDAAAVPQKDRLRELHLYAVGTAYLELRQKLGIAIEAG
ncbi:MAG: tetratricopeptide repeat protein [Myxococcota bacterium]|nr:tetratricopeptide repeat protein [Myxococcota bacterium]MDW8361520.1 tetratricopeptide repeat protein [Myxococcales bacterium]